MLLFLVLYTCISIAVSQPYPYPVLEKGGSSEALHGISTKMLYRTEIRSKAKQTELIKKIKGFLIESGLLDTENARLDKITDKLSSFSIPLQFRSGFVAGKGKTILAKRLRHPVVLSFDAEFVFADSIISITFTNFTEKVFYEIKYYSEGNYAPELGSNYAVGDPIPAKIEKLKDDVMQGATLFGKIMTVYDAGGTSGTIKLSSKGVSVESDNRIKDKFSELNKTLNEQYNIIDDAVAKKIGLWLSGPVPLEYFNKLLPKYKKYLETASGRIGEGYLLVVDNDRWDNYFEKVVFNDALLNIANLISGEIKEIKKDNVVKYIFSEGILQPVQTPK